MDPGVAEGATAAWRGRWTNNRCRETRRGGCYREGRTHGGPYRLQIWQRGPDGTFAQSYAGEGPAYSAALGAHLVVIDGGRALRIADDAAGERLWLTTEEAERAQKELERAAKEAALTRVAELEAELAKRR